MRLTAEEQKELIEMLMPHVEEYAERTILQILCQIESNLDNEIIFANYLQVFEKAIYETENMNLFKRTNFIDDYKYEKELKIKIAKARAAKAARAANK